MSYEVLARKWRPQTFEDVIGQEHIAKTLMNAIRGDRVAHAYLFSGSRGVGKTSVARIFAKAINCTEGEPGTPCNKCRSCVAITEGSSVDVQEIDGASNRGIDEIRELRDSIKYMPSSSRYRVYIIDEVHMLTLPAFNALLKTLEEPPDHVKFICATTETHKVPVTIISRCQRYDFKRIPMARIIAHLRTITNKEEIEIEQSGIAIISREAEGSMRDAESLLDQVISFAGQKIAEKDVTDILGIIDRSIIFETSAAMIEGSSEKCIHIIEKIYNHGHDIKEFYKTLMVQFRNLLMSLISTQDHLLNLSDRDKEEIQKQAQIAGEEKLHAMLNFLIKREGSLRYSSSPRLILETTLIKLCHMDDFLSFGDLLRKIGALEKRLANSPVQDKADIAQQISDPANKWDGNSSGPEIEKPVPATTPKEKTWEDFLAFLAKKNGPMYAILKGWKLNLLEKNELEIAGEEHSFSATYFDDKDKYNQLVNYCSDFFDKKVQIKISVSKSGPPLQRKNAAKAPSGADKTKTTSFPPPVQDIMTLFEGKIVGEDLNGVK
jgi:DNA polymerase-3 subunit gamma/tau